MISDKGYRVLVWLDLVAAAPEHQRRGIGRHLPRSTFYVSLNPNPSTLIPQPQPITLQPHVTPHTFYDDLELYQTLHPKSSTQQPHTSMMTSNFSIPLAFSCRSTGCPRAAGRDRSRGSPRMGMGGVIAVVRGVRGVPGPPRLAAVLHVGRVTGGRLGEARGRCLHVRLAGT